MQIFLALLMGLNRFGSGRDAPGNLTNFFSVYCRLLNIRTAESNLAVNILSIRLQSLYGQLVNEVLRKN